MSEKENIVDFFSETYSLLNNSSSKDIISHSGDVKELLEEKLAISLLGLHLDRFNNTQIEYYGKNHDGGDGKIIIDDCEFIIEVTFCYSYEESLRAEKLIQDGVVPGAGSISRNKKTKEIEATMEAVDFNQEIIEISKKIIERINNKLNKEYPPKTILIVAFESSKIYSLEQWFLLKKHINKIDKKEFHSIYLCNVLTKTIFKLA